MRLEIALKHQQMGAHVMDIKHTKQRFLVDLERGET